MRAIEKDSTKEEYSTNLILIKMCSCQCLANTIHPEEWPENVFLVGFHFTLALITDHWSSSSSSSSTPSPSSSSISSSSPSSSYHTCTDHWSTSAFPPIISLNLRTDPCAQFLSIISPPNHITSQCDQLVPIISQSLTSDAGQVKFWSNPNQSGKTVDNDLIRQSPI